MATVFISGSMQIKNLDANIKMRIENVITSNLNVVLGDADGVDFSIQNYLTEIHAKNVVIYCSGNNVRNNIGHWVVKYIESDHVQGTRAFFTAKDIALANDADYGLMIWDTKSTGTLSNVIELLTRKKKSVIYVNKEKKFLTVANAKDLETLVNLMTEVAFKKADEKINLRKKIDSLKFEQTSLF
jgi:hypothetical protein